MTEGGSCRHPKLRLCPGHCSLLPQGQQPPRQPGASTAWELRVPLKGHSRAMLLKDRSMCRWQSLDAAHINSCHTGCSCTPCRSRQRHQSRWPAGVHGWSGKPCWLARGRNALHPSRASQAASVQAAQPAWQQSQPLTSTADPCKACTAPHRSRAITQSQHFHRPPGPRHAS